MDSVRLLAQLYGVLCLCNISPLDRDTRFSPLPRVHLAGILAVVP